MRTSKRNIIIGQTVTATKAQRARELRQAMTPAEKKFWAKVRANRLGGYHFRRQQVIDGFITDFYCHATGLVVELDGGIHRQQADYDAHRDQVLAARQLHIVRISNQAIFQNLEGVLKQILELCEQLTIRPTNFPDALEE